MRQRKLRSGGETVRSVSTAELLFLTANSRLNTIVPEKIASGTLAELRPVLPAKFQINSIQLG